MVCKYKRTFFFQASFVEKMNLYRLNCCFVKDELTVFVLVYFCSGLLWCVPLIYASISLPSPWCICYCIFIVSVEITWCDSPRFVLASYSTSLVFNISLGIILLISAEITLGFDWDYIESVDQGQKKWHFNNIDSFSSCAWNIFPFILVFWNFFYQNFIIFCI